MWQQFVLVGELLLGGFLVNFVPYFMQDRTMFLHHYLPGVLFKFMVLAAVIDHVYSVLNYITQHNRLANQVSKFTFVAAVLVWCSAVYHQFHKYCVLNQGTTILTPDHLQKLQWRESWDFVYSL
ncbi:protein O-mannosyl-transferase 1-like [Lingula anatina]|uniref:Protein O-mannosyl-transferase 1-like n=1 Tax=Lingula anatina TaxID=7574 RepID=A0A1S3KCW2_LINAN|nr:protein O-mannosyl-transferase 1-like [Lingula anatina]|eukprot:XP_013420332.1 protein O-mannosyl-transferase 1-like [Lingula anatina]